MKKYFETSGSPVEIKISTGYELGGQNYFTGTVGQRGYYLYAQPVERSASAGGFRCESTMLFSGFKVLLVPTKRKSKKAEEQAEEMAKEQAYYYAQQLASQEGLELTGIVDDAEEF
jgi:hypothetical protein